MKEIRNLSEKEVFVASQYKKEKMYWLDKLSGELIKSHFPYDHKKTGKNSEPEMNTVGFALKGELFAKLMDITNGLDHRVHMFLAAGLMILLGKYTGNHDIIFGTPIYKQEIEGEFINTVLTLRNHLEPNMSFREVLLQVRQTLAEAAKNQNYPVKALLNQLDLPVLDDPEEFPLFDVVILLENLHDEKYLEEISPNIIFSFFKSEQNLVGALKYNPLLYDLTTIERIISHFIRLLHEVVKNIHVRWADIDILSGQEKQRLLLEFNDTRQVYPRDRTIDDLFEQQAAESPDKVALVGQAPGARPGVQCTGGDRDGEIQRAGFTLETFDKECALTYLELNRRSRQLALHLRTRGIKPDTVVGIMMPRSLEMLIGVLGILEAGGAYLALDPQYPVERKKYMITESMAAVLLIDGPGRFAADLQLISMNLADPGLYAGDSRDTLEKKHRFDSLAYVIYTSGSTGKPKGVMITHRSVVRLVKNTNYTRFSEDERLLQTGALEFDASTFEIWGALLNGMRLHLVSRENIVVAENLKKTVRKHHISTMWLTSPLFNQLSKADIEIFAGLRNLLVGGDVLAPVHINRLRSRFPGLNIINGYGPTENTTFSTTFLIDRVYEERIPIGTPITNSFAYILDGYGNLLPVMVAGELYVGGDGVARGYLNNPELTAGKFFDKTLSSLLLALRRTKRAKNINQPGAFRETLRARSQELRAKLYKTGDLARWLVDGNIDFLGRIDCQVKIRGFRIELGEIERQLQRHEGIKDAVVVPVEEEDGDRWLCAYYVEKSVKNPGTGISAGALKKYLGRELPAYLVPSYFVSLEEIPLTRNGKVDRRALSRPGVVKAGEIVAPGDEIEKKLAVIWSEVLSLEEDKIGIDTDFFELGGHSLRATRLAARVHKEFNVILPLLEVFSMPTIRELAQYLRGSAGVRFVPFIPISPAEKREFYPLSSAQERLFILNRLKEDSIGYNTRTSLVLLGNLERERLEETFSTTIKRHECLRTSFEIVEDEPVQRVHDEVEFAIEYYDLSRETGRPGDREEVMPEPVIETFFRTFDLSRAPLARVGLIKNENSRHLLMIETHHIISDGTSVAIFVKDFTALYSNEELPPLRIQYKDYSEWQNSPQREGMIKDQEKYWNDVLKGQIPVLNLPLDYARPAVQSFEGQTLSFGIGLENSTKLRELAASRGVTLFMLLLAIYYLLLFKLSGLEDIVVGTGIEGRRHEDLGQVIGMFVNTLCLRNRPTGEKTFIQFLDELKENTLGVFKNQEYPFEDLVENLQLHRDIARNPLFDVMFQLNNMESARLEIPGVQLKRHETKLEISKFDMTLFGQEGREELSFALEYCTSLFKETTIRIFTRYFIEIAAAVAANPGRKLWEIIQISKEKKEKILFQLNDALNNEINNISKTNHPLQNRLNKNLKTNRDKVALEYGNHFITYAVLDLGSNYIADWLINRGMNKETPIGILMNDRMELVFAIIGILKAGCVFVPLDPTHPPERLGLMIGSTGINYLIVDKTDLSGLYTSEVFRRQSPEVILIDVLSRQAGPGRSDRVPNVSYRGEDKIYIYFTSGTTGTPVAMSGKNKSLVHFIDWEIETLDVIHNYRVSQLTTPGFDAFLRDVFVPLCAGGVICIPGKTGILADPAQLKNWVRRCRIHLIHCMPPVFRLLIPGEDEETAGNEYKNLKFILLSGETVNPPDLAKWYDAFKDRVQLVNLWGTSETTLAKTWYLIRESDRHRVRIPVGKPIRGAGVVVLNKNLEICDQLVTGELYIRTPFRTYGYLNNPDLNEQRFVPAPFDKAGAGVPLHKTGDLGRVLADGNLDVLGRIDRQVKVQGIRIELEEIEHVLTGHPGVKEAVVVRKKLSTGSEVLCAYITGTGEETAVATYLRKKLPRYMVPAKILRLERIPRKPNGKVDYAALPDALTRERTVELMPGNDIEKRLARLWSDILGIEKICVTHDFFELGGNSLKAMLLFSKIHKEFDIRIPLGDIFNKPTIKQQAGILKSAREDKFSPIRLVEKKDFYALPAAQRRVYVLYRMNADTISYNMPLFVVLEGKTQRDRIEEIFCRLVKRHESLRTSFHLLDGEPVQRVRDKVDFEIEYYDLALEGKERMTGKEEHFGHRFDAFGEDSPLTLTRSINTMFNSFVRSFDLSGAPLLRVGLIHTPSPEGNPGDKYLLMVDMHHIVSDRTSIAILVDEFLALYHGKELASLRLRYKDYSEWQNSVSQREAANRQEEYWLKVFAGEIPVLILPTDYARPGMQSFEGSKVSFRLGKQEKQALNTLARENEATLFMVLLALFSVLLSKISGQEDIVIGTTIEGRNHEDLRRVIGLFVNFLALRQYPKTGKTFVQFLKEVKESTLDAFENQEYPFEELVAKAAVNRDTSRNPLFDAMFQFHTVPQRQGKVNGLKAKTVEYAKEKSKVDLTLWGIEEQKTLLFVFEYCTALFKGDTIQCYSGYLKEIVKDVLADPAGRLADIQIVPGDKKEEILAKYSSGMEEEWNESE